MLGQTARETLVSNFTRIFTCVFDMNLSLFFYMFCTFSFSFALYMWLLVGAFSGVICKGDVFWHGIIIDVSIYVPVMVHSSLKAYETLLN